MTVDEGGLSHCVVFSCHNPTANGSVYCANHASLIPEPSPAAPIVDLAPDGPPAPDMTAMEPHWDGENWILKPKVDGPDLGRVRELVRQLVAELGEV